MFSNPNGENGTMPTLLASDKAHQPVTGGLYSRLSSSNPCERRL